ncbi:MAG: hypothetical protein ACKOOC_08465 [Cyanobium sp.]
MNDRICDPLFSIVGAELLAQATWGHGSSRVFLHPGHLEPLGDGALERCMDVVIALDED